jgi:hypothetical protein
LEKRLQVICFLSLNGTETQEMEDKIEKAFAIHYFLQTWKN